MATEKMNELQDRLIALVPEIDQMWKLAADLDIAPVREMLHTLQMQAVDVQIVLQALTEK